MKNFYLNLCFAMNLVFAGSVIASEYPVYSEANGEVHIPSITVDGLPGAFQDAVLKFEDEDTLSLRSITEGSLAYYINDVELIQTTSLPTQVFLRVSGDLPNGCAALGQTPQLREGNTFTVQVYFDNARSPVTSDRMCTQALVPFSRVIPLNVYGLPAGTYEYRLNERFSGSFTLTADNSL